MTKQTFYTVHAFRFGDRELHSYIVGVYAKKQKALDEAQAEAVYRGGKYRCEVREWTLGQGKYDESPGMPSKVILELDKLEMKVKND